MYLLVRNHGVITVSRFGFIFTPMAFFLVVMTCYDENYMVIDISKICNVKIKVLKLSSVVMLSCQSVVMPENSANAEFKVMPVYLLK